MGISANLAWISRNLASISPGLEETCLRYPGVHSPRFTPGTASPTAGQRMGCAGGLCSCLNFHFSLNDNKWGGTKAV